MVEMDNEENGVNSLKELNGKLFQEKEVSVESKKSATEQTQNIPVIKLSVTNVAPNVKSEDIKDLFTKYGLVTAREINEGSGYVNVEATGDIQKAIKEMNGFEKTEPFRKEGHQGSAGRGYRKGCFPSYSNSGCEEPRPHCSIQPFSSTNLVRAYHGLTVSGQKQSTEPKWQEMDRAVKAMILAKKESIDDTFPPVAPPKLIQVFDENGDSKAPGVITTIYGHQSISSNKSKNNYWQDVKRCKEVYGEAGDKLEERSDRMKNEMIFSNFQSPTIFRHPYEDKILQWNANIQDYKGSDSPNPKNNSELLSIHLHSDVLFIDTMENFRQVVKLLQLEKMITFDLEGHQRNLYRNAIVSLIQLSSSTTNYVIDALNPDMRQGIRTGLKCLLENENILKVGVGVGEDVRSLQRDFNIYVHPLIDLQPAVTCWLKLNKIACIVCLTNPCAKRNECTEPSLQKIVSYFYPDNSISKLPQRADWSKRPMHQDLIRYASLDTSVPMKIWSHIYPGFGQSEPNFLQFVQEVVLPSKKKALFVFDWEKENKYIQKILSSSGLYGAEKDILLVVLQTRDWLARRKNEKGEEIFSNKLAMEIVKEVSSQTDVTTLISKLTTLTCGEKKVLMNSLDEIKPPAPPAEILSMSNTTIQCTRCHETSHTMGMCAAPRVRTQEDKDKAKKLYRDKRKKRRQEAGFSY